MNASTLLAALIAASTATNGVITVGDTQPYDQVRLYQNPANGTVLTNRSSDGSIDTSTTALVITGATAPTGLVFTPNLAVLRNVTSDIKLLVDTPVELTITVNIAGTLTEMTVEAGKTSVLTLGLIAGIPMIVGSHGFFELATDGNGAVGGLLLVPTGAVESADGEFQRFAYDGTNTFDFELQGRAYQIPIWYADLPLANRQSEYQISLKMPDLVEFGSAKLYLVDADFDLDFFLSPSSLNHLLLQLRPEDEYGGTELTVSAFGNSELSSTIVFTQPAAGSVISLTLNSTSIDYAWDGGSGTLPIPAGFFANPPNVLVFSSGDTASHIADLSVRVADLPPPLIG